jgi:uncharacterized protein (DUF4415 family)
LLKSRFFYASLHTRAGLKPTFKASGTDWQTRINAALRQSIAEQQVTR